MNIFFETPARLRHVCFLAVAWMLMASSAQMERMVPPTNLLRRGG